MDNFGQNVWYTFVISGGNNNNMFNQIGALAVVVSALFIMIAVAFAIVTALYSFVFWDNWFSELDYILAMLRISFVLAVVGAVAMVAYDYKGFKEAAE